jgi:multiple sugar transport system ATP-binding protein
MTLSTKVCLLETGVVQQFAPPLEIYRRPSNVFVAGFMGNPTLNFIDADVISTEGGAWRVKFGGIEALFTPLESSVSEAPQRVIIGVRPEHIAVADDLPIAATAYATLPTGMETTVKLNLGDQILSAVVFGSIDYEVDAPLHIDFTGTDILVFDADSNDRIAAGSMKAVA